MNSIKTSEQIENEIKNLQQKLHEANIREGKVSLAQEVKKRILEVAPNTPNIEYILWPIRVYTKGEPSSKEPRRTYLRWNDPEVQKMVEAKDWDGIISKYGVSKDALNNYLYRRRKDKECTISV